MKKKILKRVIAVVLSLSVMLSGGTSAFAKQADGPEYTLKDYLNDNGINLEKVMLLKFVHQLLLKKDINMHNQKKT